MLKLPDELAQYLLKFHYDLFGYICDQGAVIGDKEFTISADEKGYSLVHKSELEESGIFVRIKPKNNE